MRMKLYFSNNNSIIHYIKKKKKGREDCKKHSMFEMILKQEIIKRVVKDVNNIIMAVTHHVISLYFYTLRVEKVVKTELKWMLKILSVAVSI